MRHREPPLPDALVRGQILVTAVVFGLLAARLGPTPVLLAPSWTGATGTALALRARPRRVWAWCWGLFTLVAVLRPGAVGSGDVKLAGSLAFQLDWQDAAAAVVAAMLLTWPPPAPCSSAS